MSGQDYGVLLHDASDVLPQGLVGTPWEIIFNALRDVLKSGVGASDSDFMRKACALYFLARGDLDAVTDRGVLNGIAAALSIPYWVEDFENPEQASAVLYHWINYLPTRAKLTALALASGMRAFKLREIYTSTEYGLSHTFGFDLGEGYETSFFAGPNAEPGLSTAQRICGALTHFFLRIKDAPTLITDINYPNSLPSGWRYFFRADQSEIRILQGYNWDLYDADGNLAFIPDEYAVVTPVAVRDTFGNSTAIGGSTQALILSSGQIRLSWGQSPADAYCLYATVEINIPGMLQTWLSLDHTNVNLPPKTIPGSHLFDGMGDAVFGHGWEIFAAYDADLNRIDINDLYLSVGAGGFDPVYLRSNRYIKVCSVWLSYTPPPMIIVITPSVTLESFYFTANGASETEDTPLEAGTYLVYDASGNTIDDPDTVYNGSLATYFTEESGNMTVADGEYLEFTDGHLKLNMDGNTRSAWSVQVEYAEWINLFGVMSTTESSNSKFASNKMPFGVMTLDS